MESSFVNALNSFVRIAHSYSTTNSDSNLSSLHRQLDILSELPASESGVFTVDARHLALTEAVSCLVTLLNDRNRMKDTIPRIFKLFQKWVVNPTLHDVLKTFQLGSTIASFVSIQNDDSESELIVSQGLEILKMMTCNAKLDYADVYLEDFLKFLVRNAQMEPPTNRTLNCVVILANICRKNVVVQNQVRNMDRVKYFYRSIVNMISSPSNDLLQVAALSMFASVASNEEIGSKLFHSKNVIQTLKLIFNKISNKDSDVQCFAIDTLIDLLAIEKIQRSLLQYDYLGLCLMKILCSLDEQGSPKSVCKIYELLLTMASLSILCQSVDKAIQDAEANPACGEPISVALYWLSCAPNKQWNPAVWAAKFVTQMLKNSGCSSASNIYRHFDSIVSTITSCLDSLCEVPNSNLAPYCEKMVSSLQLLLTLCENNDYVSKVVLHVDLCTEAIDFLVEHFGYEFDAGDNSLSVDNKTCIVDAILHTFLVMIKIKNRADGMQNCLYEYIQDPTMMPIFACALTVTESADLVNNALQLVILGSKMPDFPMMRLVEAMTTANRFRGQYSNVLRHDVSNIGDQSDRLKFANTLLSTTVNMEPISEIINQFEKGLEIKDVKSSVIMEMYEHKILSLEMKEKHLQGLLDAKAAALQHADRILAEYRSRWARSDAEALQLRQVLKESEKCSEAAKEEATKALSQRKQLERDLQAFNNLANELEQKNEELMRNEIEKLNRIQSLQNAHKDLSKENKMLSETNVVLQKSRDQFEAKTFEFGEQLSEVESDNRNLKKQLKERDAKVKDLMKAGRQLELDNENLTETCRKNKDEITSLQTNVSHFSEKCGEQERELETLRAEMKECSDQLDKHKKLTEMIHNMSALQQQQQQQK